MQLQREERANQEQFDTWAHSHGGSITDRSKEVIPSGVDLMERPECLDDLLALATAVCSRGSNLAMKFWAFDRASKKISPSALLQECMSAASGDESLVPSVLSWLASLSFDEASSTMVFDLLSFNPERPAVDAVAVRNLMVNH